MWNNDVTPSPWVVPMTTKSTRYIYREQKQDSTQVNMDSAILISWLVYVPRRGDMSASDEIGVRMGGWVGGREGGLPTSNRYPCRNLCATQLSLQNLRSTNGWSLAPLFQLEIRPVLWPAALAFRLWFPAIPTAQPLQSEFASSAVSNSVFIEHL